MLGYNRKPFGVNVIGCVSSNTGIGVSARNIVRLLLANGCPISILDLDPGLGRVGHDMTFSKHFVKSASDLIHPVNLTILPMLSVPDFLVDSPFELINDSQLNVGCFWWELGVLPKQWVDGLQLFDVLLAGSRFIQATLDSQLSNVFTMFFPHPLYLLSDVQPARARFGLADDAIVYVTICEPTSDLNRKNPFAAVESFNRALSDNPNAHLMIRVNNPGADRSGASLQQLQSRCASNPRIHLIDGTLSYREVLSLYASADVFVALHRSEGLGLGLMEAMSLGKPVIATGWSGNMSFMDHSNSCLVGYSLIDVQATVPVYQREFLGKQALWADPDTEQASAWMKMLADEPELRKSIGRKAAEDMARYQQQAERGAFLDELRHIIDNRAVFIRDAEKRKKGLERFRAAHLDAAISPSRRLSRRVGRMLDRYVLWRFQ